MMRPIAIYPKTHYVTPPGTIKRAVKTIKEELDWWEPQLIEQGKLLEAQRLHQRTMYDLEMFYEPRFLPRCRELFAPSHRPQSGRATADPFRLSARRHDGRH